MRFCDIYIADSGRAVRNNNVVTYVTARGSGTIQRHQDGINEVIYPSGVNGNVAVSYMASRLDDTDYYVSSRSGVYIGATRDVRQPYM